MEIQLASQKKYANQSFVKRESIKCFNKLKRKKKSFEMKVLTIPRGRRTDGLIIEIVIPVKDLNNELDGNYCISENKIFSKQGIKVHFFKYPREF
ncbi:hypothetical protein [Listeria aquatica]|uniref:Uncharacterized protein n=1 Tax=Listeria aquatica FSL S10-1188 TaxID=1265818 RepID=W7BEH6_9LIST|nr:hypothetical protein [Listeria aquatica]EUJ21536.1 hypothetical protein MAQA_02357 [Listeria aquatica FSL S10-1188]